MIFYFGDSWKELIMPWVYCCHDLCSILLWSYISKSNKFDLFVSWAPTGIDIPSLAYILAGWSGCTLHSVSDQQVYRCGVLKSCQVYGSLHITWAQKRCCCQWMVENTYTRGLSYFITSVFMVQNVYCTAMMSMCNYLHNRPWISPWIKSISNELDITIHVIASQFSGHCDIINNQLWCHLQNENRANETQGRCVKIMFLSSFMDSVCRIRNKIMYVILWLTVFALTRVLFWYLFPSLLRNSGNKHQNNRLVNAETVRHSSAYIILYLLTPCNKLS